MSGLYRKIAYLYPLAEQGVHFRVEDRADGAGEEIAFWDEAHNGPRPSKAALAALDADPGYQAHLAALEQRRLRPELAEQALRNVLKQWNRETPQETKARVDALDMASLRDELSKTQQATGKLAALVKNRMLD